MPKALISITKKTNLGNYENFDLSIQLEVENATDSVIHAEFDRLRNLLEEEVNRTIDAMTEEEETVKNEDDDLI